jgi:hypothetical protein
MEEKECIFMFLVSYMNPGTSGVVVGGVVEWAVRGTEDDQSGSVPGVACLAPRSSRSVERPHYAPTGATFV